MTKADFDNEGETAGVPRQALLRAADGGGDNSMNFTIRMDGDSAVEIALAQEPVHPKELPDYCVFGGIDATPALKLSVPFKCIAVRDTRSEFWEALTDEAEIEQVRDALDCWTPSKPYVHFDMGARGPMACITMCHAPYRVFMVEASLADFEMTESGESARLEALRVVKREAA